jgi:hypothetical protein
MTIDHLGHLQAESTRFLDVLRDADPRAQVPSCPDWKADDLLWHLTEVQWFWGTVVRERLPAVPDVKGPERPGSHGALLTSFADQSRRLHDALAEADPAEPVYM